MANNKTLLTIVGLGALLYVVTRPKGTVIPPGGKLPGGGTNTSTGQLVISATGQIATAAGTILGQVKNWNNTTGTGTGITPVAQNGTTATTPSGATVTVTSTTTAADGSTITTFSDGSSSIISPDGQTTTYENPDGSQNTSAPTVEPAESFSPLVYPVDNSDTDNGGDVLGDQTISGLFHPVTYNRKVMAGM